MKRIIALTTATFMGATMLATPVLAQLSVDTNADVGISGSADTKNDTMSGGAEGDILLKSDADDDTVDAEVDTGVTAAIGNNFEDAMSRIGASGSAEAIASASEVGEVRVVSMGTLADSDKARIDQAMGESQAEIEALQAAVEANQSISAELAANNVAASDVIAADVAANGSVVVYTR